MIMFISKVLLYPGFALIICWQTHFQSRWTFVYLSGDAFTLLWSKINNTVHCTHALLTFYIFSLLNCRYFRGAFFWRGASWGLGVVLFLFVLFYGVVSVIIFITRDEKHLNYKWNHRQCAYFCLVVIALTQYFLFLFPFL